MPDAPALLGAPYAAPDCRPGDWIEDEIDGLTEVGGWTSAPVPWPRRRKTGRASLILTAELARAVRTESVEAIRHHWGVGPTRVWMWRRALSVGRVTDGTRCLLREHGGPPAEAAALGRAKAATPESIARMSATKAGRPVTDERREELRTAARLPRRRPPAEKPWRWTQTDDRFLVRWYGHLPTAEIARRLGRSKNAVKQRAHDKRLTTPSRWTEEEHQLLARWYGELPAGEIARWLGRSRRSVYARALKHGFSSRWPPRIGAR